MSIPARFRPAQGAAAAAPGVCERMECRRLLSAGDPDPTFGGDGRATLDFPGQPFIINDVAVQPGGKLVVAGSKAGNLAVARFNVDGTVDESFGNGGLFESSRWHAAGAVAVQNDGKILLTLPTNLLLGSPDFLVARVTQNGQNFDTAFGTSGIANAGGRFERYNDVREVVLQEDGKIVAAGFAGGAQSDEDFAVVRYNADGSLDASFDGDGVATVGFGADEAAADVAIDYNGDSLSNPFYGTIVLAGQKADDVINGGPPPADSRFAVARLRPDGSPDDRFDGDGKLTAPAFPGGPNSVGTGVLVQSFGMIVVVGYVGPNGAGARPDFALARFGADGALDPAFGPNGTGQVETDFGGRPDAASDVTAGDFGGLMVAGTTDRSFTVAAYTPDGVPDTRFGGGDAWAPAGGSFGPGRIAAGPGRRLYVGGGGGTVVFALTDVGPVITVQPVDTAGGEAGQDPASFRVVRDEPLSGPRRVFFDVSGTARKPGITFPIGRLPDYNGTPDTLFPRDDSGQIPYVDIPAGSAEAVVTITPAQDTLAEGLESAIFAVRPHAANGYDVGVPDDVSLFIADDEAPNPAVTQVYADSTAWTEAFRSHLQSKGLGSAALGYRIPMLAGQLDELPWANVNRFRVVFSEDVDVQAGDLSVRGVNTASYPLAAGAAGFNYDPSTFTATWTLAVAGVGRDKILLDVDADAATGGVTARSTGNLLDGEWNNPAGSPPQGGDVFPSGNGAAGGDFRFQVNVLPGDINGSGTVDSSDFIVLAANFGRSPRNHTQGDLTGELFVSSADFVALAANFGRSLPAADPAAVAASPAVTAAAPDTSRAARPPRPTPPARARRRAAPRFSPLPTPVRPTGFTDGEDRVA